MIGAILFILGGSIVYIYGFFASSIILIMPQQFTDAITYFFGTVNVLSPIFPIQTLMTALLFLLSVWGVKIGIKIFLWLISFIPGIGHKDLPQILDSNPNTLDLQRRGNNTIDLKHRLFKGRRIKSTRDIR